MGMAMVWDIQEGQRPQLEGDGQAADNLVYHRAAGGEGIADYPVLPKPGAMVKVIVVSVSYTHLTLPTN